MDFKSIPVDKHRFDTVFIVIDRLSKQAISEPCCKTATVEDMARLFIKNVYRYYSIPLTVVSDRGP
jgi:hypothetical protein